MIPWGWLRARGYGSDARTELDCWHEIAEQIADRLVAWMRWRGKRRFGPTAPWFVAIGDSILDDDHWGDVSLSGLPVGPGFYHLLDPVASYSDRIAVIDQTTQATFERGVLSTEVRHPSITPESVVAVVRPTRPYRYAIHRDVGRATVERSGASDAETVELRIDGGVNWVGVAVLLDEMEGLGIGLDAIHAWRDPAAGQES